MTCEAICVEMPECDIFISLRFTADCNYVVGTSRVPGIYMNSSILTTLLQKQLPYFEYCGRIWHLVSSNHVFSLGDGRVKLFFAPFSLADL